MLVIQARESLQWNARIQVGNGLPKKHEMRSYLDGLERQAGIPKKGSTGGLIPVADLKPTTDAVLKREDLAAWMDDDEGLSSDDA